MAFESSEDPEAAPSDPVSHFVNVLLGGRSAPSNNNDNNNNNKPATAKPQQQQQQQEKEKEKPKQGQAETSLFALQMTPTQAPPRVHALGLTEGLLPSEELITHHWSSPSATNRTPSRRQQQPERQATHSPLASLWHQINNRRVLRGPPLISRKNFPVERGPRCRRETRSVSPGEGPRQDSSMLTCLDTAEMRLICCCCCCFSSCRGTLATALWRLLSGVFEASPGNCTLTPSSVCVAAAGFVDAAAAAVAAAASRHGISLMPAAAARDRSSSSSKKALQQQQETAAAAAAARDRSSRSSSSRKKSRNKNGSLSQGNELLASLKPWQQGGPSRGGPRPQRLKAL
ncbi:hypothetical protein Emed_001230 [Eimeria media]